MQALILRRRKLGRTSTREISRMSKEGIISLRNDKPFPQGIDMVFRWGTTSNLPYKCQVVNEAAAIHEVADKAGFRKRTADAGLAPTTWMDLDSWSFDGCRKAVLRRSTHHQGKYLHVIEDYQEAEKVAALYGEGSYYISEYVEKVAEYRVFIVQGRVVWVARKTPANPEAVAWNVAKGGRFDNVRWGDWPLREVRVAREAFLMSSLDFGGVDIMTDRDGKCYVLEINSAPSQTSPYRQECTSKAFDYIVKHGKDRIPVAEAKGDWKKFAHPSLSEEVWK